LVNGNGPLHVFWAGGSPAGSLAERIVRAFAGWAIVGRNVRELTRGTRLGGAAAGPLHGNINPGSSLSGPNIENWEQSSEGRRGKRGIANRPPGVKGGGSGTRVMSHGGAQLWAGNGRNSLLMGRATVSPKTGRFLSLRGLEGKTVVAHLPAGINTHGTTKAL